MPPLLNGRKMKKSSSRITATASRSSSSSSSPRTTALFVSRGIDLHTTTDDDDSNNNSNNQRNAPLESSESSLLLLPSAFDHQEQHHHNQHHTRMDPDDNHRNHHRNRPLLTDMVLLAPSVFSLFLLVTTSLYTGLVHQSLTVWDVPPQPFTTDEWMMAFRDGYLNVMIAHYIRNGGI